MSMGGLVEAGRHKGAHDFAADWDFHQAPETSRTVVGSIRSLADYRRVALFKQSALRLNRSDPKQSPL